MWGPHAVKRANASCWARFHSCTTWGRTPSRVPTRPERERHSAAVRGPADTNPHHMTHRTDDIREPGATAGLSAQRSVRDRSCQVSSRNLSAQSGDDSVSVLNSVLFGTGVAATA